MKKRNRVLIILLTGVIALTFMPAMAFADAGIVAGNAEGGAVSAVTVESIQYTLPDGVYPEGYCGDTGYEVMVNGATITLTYSGGNQKIYRCFFEDDTHQGDNGFFLEPNYDEELDLSYIGRYVNGCLKEGPVNTGWVTYEDSEGNVVIKSNEFTVAGISSENIKEVIYERNPDKKDEPWTAVYDEETGRYGYYSNENLLGDKLTVTEDNKYVIGENGEGEYKTVTTQYTYKKIKYYSGDEDYGFYSDDSEFPEWMPVYFADDQYDNQWSLGETHDVEIYVWGVKAQQNAVVKTREAVLVDAVDYTFTGKKITPKSTEAVVRNISGEKIASDEYTCEMPSKKNVGVYNFTVNMTDSERYATPVTGLFLIHPKNVTAGKISRNKKRNAITIKWTQFNKTNRNQITGFRIQYSTDKKFKTFKTKTVANSKACSATIKGLKKNKTYYVRVYSYSKVKYNGGKATITSKSPSKTKSIKL